MESDPPQTILYLHKETRVDLQPAHPKSTVHFQLPSTSAFTLTSQIQRKILSSLPSSKTEEAFRKQNVASCGSLYFRPTTKYPRGILWRCLEDNTVLELRSVDLSKSEDENQEAFLVLRFGFPSPIRPEGVALADPSDQDVFNLFVLTKSNDLYTLTLRSGLFCRIEASEGDFSRWCKVFKPSLLTISTPHRLTASSSLELLVALSDGRLMRLVRKAGSDGSHWDEAAYSDGQWTSSLRGLIRWQGSNTVKYDGNLLDQNTAVAAVTSPDRKHIFAICLNHTLRAWNIKSGKLTFSRDLLDIDRDPRETARVMLDPSISQTLTIFELSGGPQGDFYYIATYSPHSSGVFKFWAVRDADHSASGVRALFPDVIFRVPDPDDGALWTMADFRLAVSPGTTELEIWVLMKLNRRYKLYHRQVDLNDMDSDWNYGWSITAADPPNCQQSHQPPLTFSNLDAEDVSDWWLDFIFFPGRIPNTILETALTIYDHDQDGNIATFKNRKTSLKNRLPKIIGTKVLLQRSDSAEEDYNNFREKLNDQWMAFWTIANELDQARLEPLSLGFDVDARMPWIVFGDACSAVRQCCQTELLIHNKPMDLVRHNNLLLKESIEEADSSSISSLPEELALLIESAARFRASFSNALRVSCKNVIKTELWQDPSYSILVRIQSFYDKCDFAGQVGDRQYNDLSASLKDLGGFDGLSTSLFESILATLPQSMSNEASGLVSTKFGLKVLVKGAQDMIELHTRLITDLLLLIVFVDMEVDRDECAMESLDTTRVYMGLVNRLKQYQIMQWLATNIRPDPARDTENSENDTNEAGNTRLADGPRTVSTVLENLFATDPKPQSYAHQPQSITLTSNIRDLLKWVTGGTDPSITLDQVLVHIQCNLLRDNNIELASSFLQFQPSTAWATYVRGRLCILEGEHSEAATYFQKAAYRLSRPDPHFNYASASAGLLSSLDASYLTSGLPNYYTHILSLFEPLSAHTQIQHFCRLALQFIHPTHISVGHSSAHSSHHNSDQQHQLLTSLFESSLTLLDYATCYTALNRLTAHHQLQALQTLITTLVLNSDIPTLLSFPFPTLKKEVDTFLASKARSGLDTPSTVPWHKVLYAWRMKQGDFRGAASALMQRIDNLESNAGKRRAASEEGGDWLVLINALAVAGGGKEEEGWVFVEGGAGKKRRVVKLEEVRREYQGFLDRKEGVERGRFGILAGGDQMDLN